MNDDYVERRRAYVKAIRNSFANVGGNSTGKSADGLSQMRSGADGLSRASFGKQADTDEEEPLGVFAIFKVKFLLCIFLFAAFVICDRTGIKFFRMSSDTVYEKVSQNYDYTNLKKYVMMVSDFDENK